MAAILDSAHNGDATDVVRPATCLVSAARQRFGRKFAHEPGSDYCRDPEPVLTRWQKKLPWQNVKADQDDDYPPDGPKEREE